MKSDESVEDIMEEKRKNLEQNAKENSPESDNHDGEPRHLDQESFFEVIQNSENPVFVDFWAPWCAPCKMVAPIIEDLAEEFKGQLVVGKLNLEEGNNRRVAQQFQVSGIPTFILFKDGEPVERIVGARNKKSFKETIQKHL